MLGLNPFPAVVWLKPRDAAGEAELHRAEQRSSELKDFPLTSSQEALLRSSNSLFHLGALSS